MGRAAEAIVPGDLLAAMRQAWEALPLAVRGHLLPIREGVMAAIARDAHDEARACIAAVELPAELEPARAAFLGMIPD